jgi:hypothetical protein
VQLEDVDVVSTELPQRIVEARHGALRSRATLAAREPGLGGDHDTVAGHAFDRLTDNAFGAVNGGGVEQIDPEIERVADEGDGFRFALAGAETEPAEPAAAEPGDADPEPGAAERDVFHSIEPFRFERRLVAKNAKLGQTGGNSQHHPEEPA